MPIVDSILSRFKKEPDPNAPPIVDKLPRSDGLDNRPKDVSDGLNQMVVPEGATDEHLANIKPPSVEEFMHPDRGHDFGTFGSTNQHIPKAFGPNAPPAPQHMGMAPQHMPMAAPRADSRLDQLEQKVDILTDKVDIVQQQTKMIWDLLKSWRSR